MRDTLDSLATAREFLCRLNGFVLFGCSLILVLNPKLYKTGHAWDLIAHYGPQWAVGGIGVFIGLVLLAAPRRTPGRMGALFLAALYWLAATYSFVMAAGLVWISPLLLVFILGSAWMFVREVVDVFVPSLRPPRRRA